MQAITPPHILLVEDYEPNILVSGTYLEHRGYTYDIARSGEEAVAKAGSGIYSAILMDVQMPGMNGFEATRAIRAFEKDSGMRRTPIIGITAYALSGDREKCLNAGMDDYLAKPIVEAMLAEKLLTCIEKKTGDQA